MSDQQLHDEVMTIMLAGHETTAVALAWTFYLLSEHPAVLEELEAEVDGV
jgi:cytochrome P450